jgi:hypothetical protein
MSGLPSPMPCDDSDPLCANALPDVINPTSSQYTDLQARYKALLQMHQNATSQLANQMMESIDIQLNHIALKQQINADISTEAAQLETAIDDLDDVLNAKKRLTEFDADDNRLAVLTLRRLKITLLAITIVVAIILLFFIFVDFSTASKALKEPTSSSTRDLFQRMRNFGRTF